ncbi:MAG: hypothetical protein KME23_21810 [Goleter apudmare HA4340-LM2]|nr:hypothetical protein [Goleter apudmare HA4340-LM2]
MLIIVLGYILPVLLIYLGLVPFTWRFYILIVAAVAILAIARLYRFSAVELGFTPQNFRNSLKAGYHYTKYRSLYRNLYSIIVSHSVLGAIAILVGLV